MYISDDCELYDMDEWDSHDYCEECKQSDLNVYTDSHGRKYANINDDSSNHKRRQHLARVAKRAFDDPKHDVEFYKTHQIDHVNPSIPLDNNISNLEWVTAAENMYRAGKTGVMQKKYKPDLVNEICQMIVDGKSRQEIINTLNVQDHLVDDIYTGKSHRSISEKYIDKGFEYKSIKHRNREERERAAEEVCKLLKSDESLTCKEIARLTGDVFTRKDITNIRRGFTYKEITARYGIDYDKYRLKNRE